MVDFRDKPTKTGTRGGVAAGNSAEQAQVVLHVLAETKPRIHRAGRSSATPSASASIQAGLQPNANLGDHVGIDRGLLHGAGLALHVHEANGGLGRGSRFESARRSQPRMSLMRCAPAAVTARMTAG
jgi:hypothetical protein